MDNIRELLLKFKEVSNEILKALKNDDIEKCLKFVEDREELLIEIKKVKIDKNIDLEKEYCLYSINKEINDEINSLKESLRSEMSKLNRERRANTTYGKQFEDIYFLNKTI